MATSVVQFRVDDDLKEQATEVYEKLGLDLSTALRIFLKRSVAVRGLPFSMTLGNEEVSAASDDEVMKISADLIEKNKRAYEELAK